MPRYVAFLRGINIGGHRLKMDRLKFLFEELGFERVATFIASGNVIFDAETSDVELLERRIEAHFHAQLGYGAATYLRTLPSLMEIINRNPFGALSPSFAEAGTYVTFLKKAPGTEAAAAVARCETPDDRFALVGREFYWLRNGRLSDSAVSLPALGQALGEEGTMRNMNTLRRIAAKFG